jgi:hypothetical protein
MTLLSRSCAAGLIGAAWVVGCGHIGFTELPEDQADSGFDAPGNNIADSGPVDATGAQDAGDLDAGVDARVDAGCTPPGCPGTYVSKGIGDDTNPGTAEKPVRSIKRGIAIASALGIARPQDVYVAGANYLEQVSLVENVSLFGGYSCSQEPCTWARDPSTFDTAIVAPTFEGAVVAGHQVTRKTRVDGFSIRGKDGALGGTTGGSVAVLLDGGAPAISHCRISGGNTTGGSAPNRRSVGVRILGPSNGEGALIDQNPLITGGTAQDASFGVLFDTAAVGGNAATATLTRNTIRSGAASFTSPIVSRASASGTLVQDNDIVAGGATGPVGVARSWGMSVQGTIDIDRNRINIPIPTSTVGGCPDGANFCGGIESLGATAQITNNVIFGTKGNRTTAILLARGEQELGEVSLHSNTLHGGGSGVAGSSSAAIVLRPTQGESIVVGTIRNNILLGGENKKRWGIFEENVSSKTIHPAAVENNVFWQVDHMYRLWTGVSTLDLDDPTTFANDTANGGIQNVSANTLADPLLDATFHLMPGSPCIDKGTSTQAPSRDMDDQSRPENGEFDIGADESR